LLLDQKLMQSVDPEAQGTTCNTPNRVIFSALLITLLPDMKNMEEKVTTKF